MIMYKTQVNGIYYNRDNNKLYKVSDGDHEELNILELMNEKNFQLSCELEDVDLRNRVIGFIKKLLISLCLIMPAISFSQGSVERYCVEPAALMQECRDICDVWFDVNYSERYKQPMSVSDKLKLDMIKRVAPVVVYLYLRDGGVLPSVKLAMGGLESGWGKTFSARERNNYFNVKSYRCMKYGCTHKVPCTNINDDTPDDLYRGYSTLFDSFDAHDRFLTKPNYCKIESMDDPNDQIDEIKNGGYATDKSYAQKLKDIAIEFVSLDLIAHKIDQELRLGIIDLSCEE